MRGGAGHLVERLRRPERPPVVVTALDGEQPSATWWTTTVAILLGWSKDAVRAACERGELEYQRDHLNIYRILCSSVGAARRATAEQRKSKKSPLRG